jgi:hypothetical protein
VPTCKKRKLGQKIVDYGFLGYAHNSTSYRFLVIKSDFLDVHVNTMTKSRDASFFEGIFSMKDRFTARSEASTSYIPKPILVSLPPAYSEQHIENNSMIAPCRSKRQRTEKSFSDEFIVYLVDGTPKTLAEAYASLDVECWKEVVHNEMESILTNGTWKICDLPACKPMGCKWLFKKKLKPDGIVYKYKARLMAKGFTQKKGEDYFDTYSLVARLIIICVLIALVVSHDLLIHQMDVKTTFVNDEEIYMKRLEGFVTHGHANMVCRLRKSLYRLKKAPKRWHEKFDRTLTSSGFVVNEADTCVYYRFVGGKGVILCLYVDDILIFGSSIDVINDVKLCLSQNFDKKDFGEADVILNIKLIKGKNGIILKQSHYVENILNHFRFIDS